MLTAWDLPTPTRPFGPQTRTEIDEACYCRLWCKALKIDLKKKKGIFYVDGCFTCMSVYHMYVVPSEARRGHWVPELELQVAVSLFVGTEC